MKATTSKDLSVDEKYSLHRARNNEHVKRSRDRKRSEEQEMQRTFVENEKRIKHLEKVMTNLSDELAFPVGKAKKKKTGSGDNGSSSASTSKKAPMHEFFGQAF